MGRQSIFSLHHQPRALQVIDHINNRPIPNMLNCFVNHIEWHQEPLPRLDWMTEAVFNGQVNLCRTKQAMEDIFQPCAVQVMELVGGNLNRPGFGGGSTL